MRCIFLFKDILMSTLKLLSAEERREFLPRVTPLLIRIAQQNSEPNRIPLKAASLQVLLPSNTSRGRRINVFVCYKGAFFFCVFGERRDSTVCDRSCESLHRNSQIKRTTSNKKKKKKNLLRFLRFFFLGKKKQTRFA